MKDKYDILVGPKGMFFKFIGSVLFGTLVSVVVFFGAMFWLGWGAVSVMLSPPWIHVFWIIPLVWGVLGMFWFESILDLGRYLMEEILDIGD